jgi:hypothetical protein
MPLALARGINLKDSGARRGSESEAEAAESESQPQAAIIVRAQLVTGQAASDSTAESYY